MLWVGDRHVVSDVNKQIFYIDASNQYGWAMSQYFPTGKFELFSRATTRKNK